ncbi:16S rRNA (cytosine(967)-C(5))-methyltransferase RsmB [Geobacter sp. DSM 9736]|uniref:16S rRNA (cytosine(967)-C(5))-methyltransferase RsmB n=1 Tax=Geobacter sp. DSM 9736 TaxID=1277350 RepID=UPI000B50BE55|nr:16S rRNA (cytosine(967)-C(5))-methyltransferase RsmB [Geobacter sp. DSM 9736]SNB47671.1 16S rRNA (cytosine967-C5)-methyltransferase [Geobacter sp. DSM 9736]
MTSPSPRRAAFDILLRVEKEKSYADILLDQALTGDALKGADRRLLTELVYGVLRRQATLDHVVSQFSSIKPAKLERAVLILLRLGLYQTLFLDRMPVSAAVNETVNLAKSLAPRASGFINAVLRRADRERESISYPSPEKDPVRFLSTRYSHPEWLAGEWLAQLGMPEAEHLASAMGEAPPLTVRTNTLLVSRNELLASFAGAGVAAVATPFAPDGVTVLDSLPPRQLPGFSEGWFAVQDESSQLAAFLLEPARGEKLLDLCAAPGGKATYLAQLMGNKGSVLACDKGARRLPLITESAARLGITIIETKLLDAAREGNSLERDSFDRVLVDAPCSGLGVLRRHPEGKWLKRKEDLPQLAAAQLAILRTGASCVKPGGTLLYATCSTSREENEAVIENFLSQVGGFVVDNLHVFFPDLKDLLTEEGYFRSWPHRNQMDGFFAARLRRAGKSHQS